MKFANVSTNLQESSLILEASKGDLDAFNHLVLKYQDLIFNQAYALLGDCHTAEDATQESFIKAFQTRLVGTVKSRLARARFRMKEKLQNTFDFPRGFNPAEAGLVAWFAR